jgi:hypothetical protein
MKEVDGAMAQPNAELILDGLGRGQDADQQHMARRRLLQLPQVG